MMEVALSARYNRVTATPALKPETEMRPQLLCKGICCLQSFGCRPYLAVGDETVHPLCIL